MNIEWNKVTWYSKLIAVVLFVLTFYIGFKLGQEQGELSASTKNTTESSATKTTNVTPISIKSQNIKEENFTGKVAVISGSSNLAIEAQKYIDQTISDFRKQANIDVPDIRAKFGAGSPPATYEIDIDATYIKGPTTESIVMSLYEYTGGANGNSTYKVITASNANGKILSLADIIKKDEQTTFTEFVKKALLNWQPEGSTAPVVFTEEVNGLQFNSFTNWSLDNKNLVIYFDKYAVGPGALGPVALPIPLSTIKNFTL